MREIKFRAWNKKQSKMGNVEQINLITNYIDTDGFVAEDENEEVVLMQYTGLKDKNGKDIYEGDIVSHKFYLRPVVVSFKDGGFTAEDVSMTDSKIEVIGNIYENPELLSFPQVK